MENGTLGSVVFTHGAIRPDNWVPVPPALNRPGHPSDVYFDPLLLAVAHAHAHTHVTYVDKCFNVPRNATLITVFAGRDYVEAAIPPALAFDEVVAVVEAACMLIDPLSVMHAAQVGP